MSEKLSDFWRKKIQQCHQNCILGVRRNVLRKFFCEKKNHFRTQSKKHWEFWRKISAGWLELHFASPDERFEDFVLEKLPFFTSSSHYEQNVNQVLVDNFRHSCQKCILSIRRNFEEQVIFKIRDQSKLCTDNFCRVKFGDRSMRRLICISIRHWTKINSIKSQKLVRGLLSRTVAHQ